MLKDPMWYQRYTDEDRVTIAASYNEIKEKGDAKKSSINIQRLTSLYRAASLILPDLESPTEVIKDLKATREQNGTKARLAGADLLIQEIESGDFSNLSREHKRDPEFIKRIADAIPGMVKAAYLKGVNPNAASLILFGPVCSVFKVIAKRTNDVSKNLDEVPQIAEGLEKAKMLFLNLITDEELKAAVLERKKIGNLKLANKVTEYNAALKNRLSSLEL